MDPVKQSPFSRRTRQPRLEMGDQRPGDSLWFVAWRNRQLHDCGAGALHFNQGKVTPARHGGTGGYVPKNPRPQGLSCGKNI